MAKKKPNQGQAPLQANNQTGMPQSSIPAMGMPSAGVPQGMGAAMPMPNPEQLMAKQEMMGQKKGGMNGVPLPKELQQGVPQIGFRGGKVPPMPLDGAMPAGESPEPYGPKVDEQRIQEAGQILRRYKEGKANLERRIIDNEEWYKLKSFNTQHEESGDNDKTFRKKDSAWLFNSIANKHADAMDNYPEPNCLPRESSDEQVARQLAEILPVVLEQNDYEQVYSDTWWYKLKHGTSVKGVYWNGQKLGGLGDIDIRRVDILKLYWEPGIMELQQSRNVFHVELVDTEILKEQYPWFEAKKGTSEEVTKYIYDDTVDTSEKVMVVDWYYKKQGVLHFCKYSSGQVLYASEDDAALNGAGFYNHGKYPFVLDSLFPKEGTPIGFGYIDVMKGIQNDIDSLRNNMIENSKWSSKPRYFCKNDGSVNEEEFLDPNKPLVHVDGNLGEDSIRQLGTPTLSDIYVTFYTYLIDEIKEVSGNRDFAQGGTTGGVTAASSIAALQEAGSKLSRDMLKSAYRAFKKECELCIELMRQFYDTQRTFRITGSDGTAQYKTFDNTGLAAQPLEGFSGALGEREPIFDVKVSAQKKSTFSREAQNYTAKELFQLGVFNPQLVDQSLLMLEMMEFEGKDKVIQKLQENKTLLAENQQLKDTMMKMGVVMDAATGSSVTPAMLKSFQGDEAAANSAKVKDDGKDETVTTNTLGGTVSGNSLQTQAQRRAMDVSNPEKASET